MTAFARQTGEFAWGSLVWEIRSVNHRYLEPGFKLPESLRMLEGELREQLRAHVARGKIECSLRLIQNAAASSRIAVNTPLLEQLIAASAGVQEKLPQAAALNPLELLAWPGVLQQPSPRPPANCSKARCTSWWNRARAKAPRSGSSSPRSSMPSLPSSRPPACRCRRSCSRSARSSKRAWPPFSNRTAWS
jgi:hypothetical protein